jgi:predicted XRE-type DNA-binding protein
MAKEKITFTKSTGNVFKDLEFSNSEEMLVKAKLASSINEILKKKKVDSKRSGKNAWYISTKCISFK